MTSKNIEVSALGLKQLSGQQPSRVKSVTTVSTMKAKWTEVCGTCSSLAFTNRSTSRDQRCSQSVPSTKTFSKTNNETKP
jgi:hypothetical protein